MPRNLLRPPSGGLDEPVHHELLVVALQLFLVELQQVLVAFQLVILVEEV